MRDIVAFLIIILILLSVVGVIFFILTPLIYEIKKKSSEQGRRKTIPIYYPKNLVEAELLKNLLEENGVSCFITPLEEARTSGFMRPYELFGNWIWGSLTVLSEDKTRAEELIASFLKKKAEQIPQEN